MSILTIEAASDGLLAWRSCDDHVAPIAGSHPPSWVRRIICSCAPAIGIVGLITLLAALAAVVISIVIPASYFSAAQARVRGEIEAVAELYAADVTEAAQQDPRLWNALAGGAHEADFDDLAISRPAATDAPDTRLNRRRVF